MDTRMVSETWRDIGAVDDIPRLGARVVATPEGNIAVFRTGDDSIYAVEDRCPHKSGPLSQGLVHGTAVTCPLHNWRVAVDCGQVVKPPGQESPCVRTYAVRVEEGFVAIRL